MHSGNEQFLEVMLFLPSSVVFLLWEVKQHTINKNVKNLLF